MSSQALYVGGTAVVLSISGIDGEYHQTSRNHQQDHNSSYSYDNNIKMYQVFYNRAIRLLINIIIVPLVFYFILQQFIYFSIACRALLYEYTSWNRAYTVLLSINFFLEERSVTRIIHCEIVLSFLNYFHRPPLMCCWSCAAGWGHRLQAA